jgi:hypothetical protein
MIYPMVQFTKMSSLAIKKWKETAGLSSKTGHLIVLPRPLPRHRMHWTDAEVAKFK